MSGEVELDVRIRGETLVPRTPLPVARWRCGPLSAPRSAVGELPRDLLPREEGRLMMDDMFPESQT